MKEFSLRPWKKEDAESLAKAANNPKVAAKLRNVFPNPYTFEDAEWYVHDCMAKEGKNQLTRAIIVDGKAVGSIGVFVKEDVYEKSAELGYWLSEDHWRQGIMSRAVIQICREAFQDFDIIRIFAEPFEDNAGSRGVLEKAGFTCEGTMRNGVYKNGRVHSYCMYSILREEAGV
ncbi:MAG: GNAT family N-acetyltransferase [Clostridiales bacterium]|nr:GNAT family N-acetyltransferase [Clostridiales bacterium]